jgi:two-component sensor histidine kinase
MRLVQALAKQLRGTVDIERKDGTRVSIVFPMTNE